MNIYVPIISILSLMTWQSTNIHHKQMIATTNSWMCIVILQNYSITANVYHSDIKYSWRSLMFEICGSMEKKRKKKNNLILQFPISRVTQQSNEYIYCIPNVLMCFHNLNPLTWFSYPCSLWCPSVTINSGSQCYICKNCFLCCLASR